VDEQDEAGGWREIGHALEVEVMVTKAQRHREGEGVGRCDEVVTIDAVEDGDRGISRGSSVLAFGETIDPRGEAGVEDTSDEGDGVLDAAIDKARHTEGAWMGCSAKRQRASLDGAMHAFDDVSDACGGVDSELTGAA